MDGRVRWMYEPERLRRSSTGPNPNPNPRASPNPSPNPNPNPTPNTLTLTGVTDEGGIHTLLSIDVPLVRMCFERLRSGLGLGLGLELIHDVYFIL